MRWSCPHCGTQLALSEDKIGTGWSFARCYRCGGFALIRRSELSVIRVDKAPAGENVLLPEATDDPRRGLSAAAALNYARAVPNAAGPAAAAAAANFTPPSPPASVAPPLRAATVAAPTIPIPPTPSIRPAPLRSAAIGREPAVIQVAAPAHFAPPPEPSLSPQHLPEPLPETPSGILAAPPALLAAAAAAARDPRAVWSNRLLYGGIGVASVAALASGAYLISEGRSLIKQSLGGARPVATAAPAEAPRTPNEDMIRVSPQTFPAAFATTAARDIEVTDEVHHLAMAPSRPVEPAPPQAEAAAEAQPAAAALTPATPGLAVRATRAGVHLYTGPGTQFQVIGMANPALEYPVKGWSDQWFKIEVNSHTVAWVRNDLVLPSSR